jgi:hypothetical protein
LVQVVEHSSDEDIHPSQQMLPRNDIVQIELIEARAYRLPEGQLLRLLHTLLKENLKHSGSIRRSAAHRHISMGQLDGRYHGFIGRPTGKG